MKLEYSEIRRSIMDYVSLIGLIFGLVLFSGFHIQFLSIGSVFLLNTIFVFLEIMFSAGLIFQIYTMREKHNIKTKELWKNGEKKLGYIVNNGYIVQVGYGRYNRSVYKVEYLEYNEEHVIVDSYISIEYDETKHIDIQSIKNNKTFKVLGMLLNPYPVKEIIKIPIDIYVYKNKAYADLDSVDLSKIKGYDELVKEIK